MFGANGLMDYQQKRRESRELDRQIKALQQQNGGMEQEIKALKNDPKTIEKEARERLRYARPGEVVYTVSLPQLRNRQRRSSLNFESQTGDLNWALARAKTFLVTFFSVVAQ